MALATATTTSSTGLSREVAVPLAYAGWWITGLILWAVERRDHRIRFHAAQSLTVFGLIAAVVVVFGACAAAALSFFPAAFTPLAWAATLSWAGGVLLWVAVMLKAATGRVWRIPIAATLAEWLTSRP